MTTAVVEEEAGADAALRPSSDHLTAPTAPRPRSSVAEAGFGLFLTLLAGVGAVVRVVHLLVESDRIVSTDAWYYQATGASFVAGEGFVNPLHLGDTAMHPPAWSVVLGIADGLGLDGRLSQQFVAAGIGVVTVVLCGLAGRQLAGARTGLLAAGIAAVYPNLWLHERTLLSETLLLPLVALLVLLASRELAAPRLGRVVAIGALTGALALVRSELALLAVLVAVPVAVVAPRPGTPTTRRAGRASAALLAALVVIAPWTIYNLGRFESPVLLSTNFGGTLRVANCPGAYEGEMLGHIDDSCWVLVLASATGDESTMDRDARADALEFVRDDLGRVPTVVAAREGRTWSFYRPFQQNALEADFAKSARWPYDLGLVAYWAMLPFAVAGGVALRRTGVALWPLLAIVAVPVIATAVTLGQTRVRAPAEVVLVLLAAAGVDALLRRRAQNSRVAGDSLALTADGAVRTRSRARTPTA